MIQDQLARLKQENEKLRKRLAATQQLGLQGAVLQAFEACCLSRLVLDEQGQISHIHGQDGNAYAPEEWLQRARQGQEGAEIQALMGNRDSNLDEES
jgi:hypothetical protein